MCVAGGVAPVVSIAASVVGGVASAGDASAAALEVDKRATSGDAVAPVIGKNAFVGCAAVPVVAGDVPAVAPGADSASLEVAPGADKSASLEVVAAVLVCTITFENPVALATECSAAAAAVVAEAAAAICVAVPEDLVYNAVSVWDIPAAD